jgi:beta-galactosidase
MKIPHITRRKVLTAIALTAAAASSRKLRALGTSSVFAVEGDHFVLGGKPFQIVSGEMHYARIPREYWRHRIQMAKAMGLNTIAAYIFWNVHEPKRGFYDFSGNNDVAAFIRLVQAEGMHVLLRAGPYSCAEWEFGGFPAWLLKDPKMATALRTTDPAFLEPAARWMRRLGEELGPLQIENGGPILATQIENEYGNFSNDHAYMEKMRDIFVQSGFTKSLLYTCDPSKALANGKIDGVYSAVNFGTGNAEHGLSALAALRPGQPLFSSEYWPGWFDLWGHPHETRPLAPQLVDLNYILSHGASINIYMFHGGSSFGMMAGASQSTGAYRGNVTSYDYDAPLDEAGHPTPKFFAYRDTILKYTQQPVLSIPPTAPVIAVAEFALTRAASLWDHLPKPVVSEQPLTMEQVDQAYGYILYRKQLPGGLHDAKLQLDHLYDFGFVYIDGRLIGTLDRHYHQDTIALDSKKPAQLDILVENTGRLNSTRWMRDERKGMRGATLDGEPLTDWQIYSLPMIELPATTAVAGSSAAPHFASGTFDLKDIGDTYLDVRSLGKGLVWINGHALGRFWNIGPQGTLYLPGPWLKKGRNEVTIFELLDNSSAPKLAGLVKPILDAPTPAYAADPEKKKKPAADAEFGPQLAAPAVSPAATPKE